MSYHSETGLALATDVAATQTWTQPVRYSALPVAMPLNPVMLSTTSSPRVRCSAIMISFLWLGDWLICRELNPDLTVMSGRSYHWTTDQLLKTISNFAGNVFSCFYYSFKQFQKERWDFQFVCHGWPGSFFLGNGYPHGIRHGFITSPSQVLLSAHNMQTARSPSSVPYTLILPVAVLITIFSTVPFTGFFIIPVPSGVLLGSHPVRPTRATGSSFTSEGLLDIFLSFP